MNFKRRFACIQILYLPKRIDAVAIDRSRQIGSDSVVVYLNHKAPVMTVTSPVDGLMTTEDTVTVEGEVGNNSITILINGIPIRPKGRRFTYNYPLSQGLNRIVILGEDTNGAVTKVVRTVRYDDLPPHVNLDFPSPGALLKALPNRICGRMSDFTPVTVTVNGAPATVFAGEFYLYDYAAH